MVLMLQSTTRPVPLRLEVTPPDGVPFAHDFKTDEVVIGRARDAHLKLSDESLSRRHARLFRRGNDIYFEDLGSRNGSMLNDVAVTAALRVTVGDQIVLGGTQIVLRRPGAVELTTRHAGDTTAVFDVTNLSGGTAPHAMFKDLASENRALGILLRAGSLLIVHRPVADMLDSMLDLALEAFGAERAAVALLASATAEPVLARARGAAGGIDLQVSRTVGRAVFDQREALAVTDVDGDPHLSVAESVRIQGVRSLMCAPLWDGAAVQGLLYVDRRIGRGHYGETDLRVLSMLANLIAVKIENERLFTHALHNQRLEEELSVARSIQERLMPESVPEIAGLQIAGTCRACSEVGGDFFDTFPLTGERRAIVVADVCGKGVAGALLAASLQAALRGGKLHVSSPSDRFASINSFIYEHSPADRYITAALVEIDPTTGETLHCSAGHPPALVVRADGSIERLVDGGLPLGLFADATYQHGSTVLGIGDRLVLYTDGITEASPGPGREPIFGSERLVAAMKDTDDAASACRAIIAALDAFVAGAPLRDDATLVVVART